MKERKEILDEEEEEKEDTIPPPPKEEEGYISMDLSGTTVDKGCIPTNRNIRPVTAIRKKNILQAVDNIGGFGIISFLKSESISAPFFSPIS